MEPDVSYENPKSFAIRYFGVRHTQALLLASVTAVTFSMRVNLSVAIVAMTTPNTSPNEDVPVFEWTDQSIILSSYYWGYVIPQVFAGHLSKRYGPKWILATSTILVSISSILIPFLAHYGSWAIIVCRIFQGLCHGFVFPCCHDMLAKWVPKNELARLGALVYSAGSLGLVISMVLTGWISGTWVGWPSAFYGHGAVGLLCTLVWIFIGQNSPEKHKGIDSDEKMYIEKHVKDATVAVPTPWKSILTSLPVWSIFISSFGQLWGFSTLLTNIPSYSANILGHTIQDNGILSATPHLVFWMLSFVFSIGADYATSHQILTRKAIRTIMNCIGFYVPGVILLTLATLSLSGINNAGATLAMFIIGVAASSACLSGYMVNHIDIAPAHAGIIMGITNGFGNISSIIGPLVVQFIVLDETDLMQWSTVFYISGGFYIVSNTFALFFSSASIQTWNSSISEDQSNNVGK